MHLPYLPSYLVLKIRFRVEYRSANGQLLHHAVKIDHLTPRDIARAATVILFIP